MPGPLAIGLMVGGSLLSAGSSIWGGAQAKKMRKKQAEAMRAAAADARRAAMMDANLIRERGQSILGSQRAAYAFSGVDMSGTPMAVQMKSAQNYERDIQTRLWKGESEARNLESGAALEKMKGSAEQTAGILQGIGSLVGMGGKLAGGTSGVSTGMSQSDFLKLTKDFGGG